MYTSSNPVVLCVARRCIMQSYSNMGRNVALFHSRFSFMDFLNSDKETTLEKVYVAITNHHPEDIALTAKASVCKELIDVRDDVAIHDIFTKTDTLSVLYTLCTD